MSVTNRKRIFRESFAVLFLAKLRLLTKNNPIFGIGWNDVLAFNLTNILIIFINQSRVF